MDRKPEEGWAPEVEELRFRRAEAAKLGGEAAVRKHHEQGRLTIRERIGALVDSGSFQEAGSPARAATRAPR
jgi:acetyl-CoA carboxylase carboxyltransferase component